MPSGHMGIFFQYWKEVFPNVVVPKSRKDICGNCFIFMNRHKYRTSLDEKESDDEPTADNNDSEEVEAIISKAYRHVKNAKLQRELFKSKETDAKDDYKANVPHAQRRYTLVADYCQNMGLPHFGGEQPGETYYYSPLSVYCFGVVDVTTDTMYAHLYEEGKAVKVATMLPVYYSRPFKRWTF